MVPAPLEYALRGRRGCEQIVLSTHKKTIQLVLGAICLMGLIIFWLTSTSSVPDNQNVEPPKVAPRAILNSTLEENKDGKKSWELTVGELVYDDNKANATLKSVDGKFYAEDGTVMHITADEGTVNLASKNITLTVKPKGTTSDGGEVTAKKITWINDGRLVVAEGDARISKEDAIATAQKATMDVAINKLKMEQKAQITKGVKR